MTPQHEARPARLLPASGAASRYAAGAAALIPACAAAEAAMLTAMSGMRACL